MEPRELKAKSIDGKATPMTLGHLRAFCTQTSREIKLKENTPIFMASDEEGNGYGKLYAIEVTQSGKIVLWPAWGQYEHPEDA